MGLAQSAVQLVAGAIAGGAIAVSSPAAATTEVEGATRVVVETEFIERLPLCLICWQ